MGDYREPKHIYTTAPNMRDENPVYIQELHEYISDLQLPCNLLPRHRQMLEDVKECLMWVELNG